jgi:hypothetical protein
MKQPNDAHSNDLKQIEIETNKSTTNNWSEFNQENNEFFYNFLYNNLLLNQIGNAQLPFSLPPSSSLSSLDSVNCTVGNLHHKSFQTPSSVSNNLFQGASHFKTSKSNFQIDNILNNKSPLSNWNSSSLTSGMLEDLNRYQLKIRMQQEQEKLLNTDLHD